MSAIAPVPTLKASNCGISATIWPIGRVLKSSSRANHSRQLVERRPEGILVARVAQISGGNAQANAVNSTDLSWSRLVRDQEVDGSNPFAPTNSFRSNNLQHRKVPTTSWLWANKSVVQMRSPKHFHVLQQIGVQWCEAATTFSSFCSPRSPNRTTPPRHGRHLPDRLHRLRQGRADKQGAALFYRPCRN
jgi:hypothetical protein